MFKVIDLHLKRFISCIAVSEKNLFCICVEQHKCNGYFSTNKSDMTQIAQHMNPSQPHLSGHCCRALKVHSKCYGLKHSI